MESVLEIVRIKQVVKKRKASHLLQAIRSPQDAAEIIRREIGDEDREVFLVLVLNVKNEVIAIHRCHVGSLNASLVHPREVMKAAILNNGMSIIVAHNHPSGNCQQSPEDIEVTKRLADAGKLMGIELLDSIIVSGGLQFVSLRDKGFF
jgi:DNA repair protein RadC